MDEIRLLPKALVDLMDLFERNGKQIYLVGGGVRNILVGNLAENCDLTTNATPEEILGLLKEKDPFYNNDFGTVSVNVDIEGRKELYEITTYRSEKEYSDFRRPDSVSWGKTLEEDVVRRDFTINAIVVGKEEGKFVLIDMVDGLKDFELGVIRAVGEPEKRFEEDALRMMRAIRFASRMKFGIETKTLEAIAKKSNLLEKISRERIREELGKIMTSEYPADGIRMLISTGMMTNIMPELLEGKGVGQGGHHTLSVLDHELAALESCSGGDFVLRFATLIHDIGKPRTKRYKCRKCGRMYREVAEEMFKCGNCGMVQPSRKMITFYGHEVVGAKMAKEIAERLKFSRKQIEKIEILVRRHMFSYQPDMTDAAIRRLIKKIGKENIAEMMLLRVADRKGSGSKTTSWRMMELQQRIGEQLYEPMEINDMVVNGNDVMEVLGVKPGPVIGRVLKILFEEVLEDTSKNQREYLLGRIKEEGGKFLASVS